MRKISVLLFLLITVYMSFDCFSKGQNNFDSNKESFKDKYIGNEGGNKIFQIINKRIIHE